MEVTDTLTYNFFIVFVASTDHNKDPFEWVCIPIFEWHFIFIFLVYEYKCHISYFYK